MVDPDNEIDELHEEWGKESEGGDPGGNNVGRLTLGLWSARPMFISGDAKNREMVYADGSTTPVPVTKAESASVAAAGTEALTLWFEPIRDDDARERLSAAEFREELAKQTEAFRAHAWALYDGRGPVTNLHVTVSHLEGDKTQHIIARKSIPALYPGKAYPFSFWVDPSAVEKEKFVIEITGPGVHLSWANGDEEQPTPSDGGSSSGCDSLSFGVLSLALAGALWTSRRR